MNAIKVAIDADLSDRRWTFLILVNIDLLLSMSERPHRMKRQNPLLVAHYLIARRPESPVRGFAGFAECSGVAAQSQSSLR
jgi:hypothetical protein